RSTHVLKPNDNFRDVLVASWVGLPPITVEAAGYPELRADLHPWRRTTIVAPGDFLSMPLVLVVPDESLVGERGNRYNIDITIRRNSSVNVNQSFPFDGQA